MRIKFCSYILTVKLERVRFKRPKAKIIGEFIMSKMIVELQTAVYSEDDVAAAIFTVKTLDSAGNEISTDYSSTKITEVNGGKIVVDVIKAERDAKLICTYVLVDKDGNKSLSSEPYEFIVKDTISPAQPGQMYAQVIGQE